MALLMDIIRTLFGTSKMPIFVNMKINIYWLQFNLMKIQESHTSYGIEKRHKIYLIHLKSALSKQQVRFYILEM